MVSSSRRRFLGLTVASAGSVLPELACTNTGTLAPLPDEKSVDFPQSVASGDPTPESLVFWTRALDRDFPDHDVELELELFLDDELSRRVMLDGERSLPVLAEAAFDFCVKARVDGLEPDTVYYYRFVVPGGVPRSRVGRARTAPADDADRSVRFGVVCCQDYDGKYYHVHRRLLAEDLDFVVHLGDYVYETASSVEPAPGERRVAFSLPGEAIQRGGTSRAARSLGNYRDLYRAYRSDRDLQALHESFAMIAITDDHEFSNDCYGATANYSDGRENETDLERRAASDQAWFEYMPVDYRPPAQAFDAARDFPDSLRIYRKFGFGRHLELVMTDERRFRPDHLVPEDAFPGAVFLREAELVELDGAVPDDAVPYVDVDEFADGAYRQALIAHAAELDAPEDRIQGPLSVPWINQTLAALGGNDLPAAIDPETSGLERGYAYHQLLKSSTYSSIGSRYVLAHAPFYALARARFAATDGASENMLGSEQRAWFLDAMKSSSRTFKVWGSELCFQPRHIDLSAVDFAPPEFRQRIVIVGEDWDGFPNERLALLRELSEAGNVVILSGDLHCFFAGTPFDPDDPEKRVIELVTGSVSSTTWLEGIAEVTESDSSIPPEARLIAGAVGGLLVDPVTVPNPHLAFQELARNGCSIVRVSAEALEFDLLTITTDDVALPPEELPAPLAERFTTQRFRVPAGARALEQEVDGRCFRWDIETQTWNAVEGL